MGKIYKNSLSHICPYCNGEFFGRRTFKKHKSDCAKEHGLKMDTLGRFVNPESGKHAIENFRKRVEAGEANWTFTGKKHSVEARKKMSLSTIKFIEEHPDRNIKWYTVNGIKVQGNWEKKVAEYLTNRNIEWKRVRIEFLGSYHYTPDFFCPKENVYFEVKGFMRDRDLMKMHLVLNEHPELKIVMIRREDIKNLENIDIFTLPTFQELYGSTEVDPDKFKKRWINNDL